MNYFELYELPESFVDEKGVSLKRKYLALSKKYHPDFHTDALDSVKGVSLDYSSLNNKAYEVLRNREKRIQYVLELNGQLNEGENKNALPPDFLMEMMEINEALMELEFDFNAAALDKIQNDIASQEAPIWDAIATPLASYKAGDSEVLSKAKNYLFKKRYLSRINEKIATFADR